VAACASHLPGKPPPAGTAELPIAVITLECLRRLNSPTRPWRRSTISARWKREMDTARREWYICG